MTPFSAVCNCGSGQMNVPPLSSGKVVWAARVFSSSRSWSNCGSVRSALKRVATRPSWRLRLLMKAVRDPVTGSIVDGVLLQHLLQLAIHLGDVGLHFGRPLGDILVGELEALRIVVAQPAAGAIARRTAGASAADGVFRLGLFKRDAAQRGEGRSASARAASSRAARSPELRAGKTPPMTW